MSDKEQTVGYTRFPVVSLSAEYLAMGQLMRRNVLAYKGPPNNEGYDLIFIHPDPRKRGRQIRVQVKNRLATDSDRGFPVKSASLRRLRLPHHGLPKRGPLFRKSRRYSREGARDPEFYTLPASFIRRHHHKTSSWEKVSTRGLNIDRYKNEVGFEQIAKALRIPYPAKLNTGEGA
jgi:hypothetical protein